MSVEAPAGVFACLRTAGDNASVVLVNMAGTKVQGRCVCPRPCCRTSCGDKRLSPTCGSIGRLPGVSCQEERVNVPRMLPPFGFTVLALRADGPVTPGRADLWTKAVDAAKERTRVPRRRIVRRTMVSGWKATTMWLDQQGVGALKRLSIGGTEVLGRPIFICRPAGREHAERRCYGRKARRPFFEGGFGRARLTLRYVPSGLVAVGDGLVGRRANAGGHVLAGGPGLAMVCRDGRGVLEDAYRVRHLPTEGVTSSI